MSSSLRPHGLQHARLLCPPLSPRVGSNSCPLSPWCYVTISSSACLFFCLQSFPAWGSFPMSQLLTSHGQSLRASASASVPLRGAGTRERWGRWPTGRTSYLKRAAAPWPPPGDPVWLGQLVCFFFQEKIKIFYGLCVYMWQRETDRNIQIF